MPGSEIGLGGCRLPQVPGCSPEYAYGPAQKLPDSKVGTFPQTLYDEAKKDGWFITSMKNDWKVIFPFELEK